MTYPQDFPVEQVTSLVSLVRDGNVGDNLDVFAHDLWVVQGYAQKVFVGDPGSGVVHSQEVYVKPVDFDAVETLDKLAKQAESGALASQDVGEWKWLLEWALQELLKVVLTRF